MRCELCGTNPEIVVILPIRQKDGRFNTLTCEHCAKLSGAYCSTHQLPHLGFKDETTACKACIDDLVEKQGEIIAKQFLGKLTCQAEYQPFVPLMGWAALVNQVSDHSFEVGIGRAIISYSLRKGLTPEEVIRIMINQGSANIILPESFRIFEDKES